MNVSGKKAVISRGWVVNWSEFEQHYDRGCERMSANTFEEVLPEFLFVGAFRRGSIRQAGPNRYHRESESEETVHLRP